MAPGIDVLFTGLMVICLSGQSNCPVKYEDMNTAWVVYANGPRRICGRYSEEETTLQVKFYKGEFEPSQGKFYCAKANSKNEVICSLFGHDLCLLPGVPAKTLSGSTIKSLPRIDEIDRRFLALDANLLKDPDYVPTRIYFPKGVTTAGPTWSIDGKPVRWYRSNGDTDQALPRELSDQLKVTYEGSTGITLTDCSNLSLIYFKALLPNVQITFENVSKYPPMPEYDDKGGYESLAYLLWYYRLGEWDTSSGKCPDYTNSKKDAVLLQCVSKKETGCVYNPYAQATTRFWPPILGPRQ